MIGFTTANRIPAVTEKSVLTQSILSEPALDHAFRAVGEATEEAVLNSMIMADTTQGPTAEPITVSVNSPPI